MLFGIGIVFGAVIFGTVTYIVPAYLYFKKKEFRYEKYI